MDIDEIENNLNNYEVNPNKTLALSLNSLVKTQAYVETLLDLQVSYIVSLLPPEKQSGFAEHAYNQLAENLAKIQAEISMHF